MKTLFPKELIFLAALLSLVAPVLAQTKGQAPQPKTGGAAAPPSKAEAAERAKLDGTWVGGVKGGGGPGKGKGKGGGGQGAFMVTITELVIKGDRITAKGDRGSDFGAGTYTVNLNAEQKTIDATGTSGRSAGKTHLGIYRLNGDTLEWCTGNPGIARPKDYFTTPQVQFHMVLTRKKA